MSWPDSWAGPDGSAVNGAEHQRDWLDVAETQEEALVKVLYLMRSEQGDGFGGEGEIPPPALGLSCLHAEAGPGFLDAPLDFPLIETEEIQILSATRTRPTSSPLRWTARAATSENAGRLNCCICPNGQILRCGMTRGNELGRGPKRARKPTSGHTA